MVMGSCSPSRGPPLAVGPAPVLLLTPAFDTSKRGLATMCVVERDRSDRAVAPVADQSDGCAMTQDLSFQSLIPVYLVARRARASLPRPSSPTASPHRAARAGAGGDLFVVKAAHNAARVNGVPGKGARQPGGRDFGQSRTRLGWHGRTLAEDAMPALLVNP